MKSSRSSQSKMSFSIKVPIKKASLKFNKLFLNKISLAFLLVVFASILISNILLTIIYSNKTYPKTLLNNQAIGSVSFTDLDRKIKDIIQLPKEITLKVRDKAQTVKSEELGLSINYQQVNKGIQQNRYKIPLVNFIKSKNNNASYELNKAISNQKIESLKPALESSPSGSHIKFQDQQFIIIPATPLTSINNEDASLAILDQLKQNKTEINLPFSEVPAPENYKNITELTDNLNKSIATKITLTFEDQTKQLSKSDIANFYIEEDFTYILSSQAIDKKLNEIAKQFRIDIENKTEAITKIKTAINEKTESKITLKNAPKKHITYRYCVATKGVSDSYISEFKNKLQAVYDDSQGWSVGGQVSFVFVTSGCNYTAWLSEASLVPSFSSTICDSTWSCRVGNNVIINFDRWSGASPAWNSAGGSLDSYRTMVINHETGHWLGFGHRYCAGTGQPAPVMQQQSISLQGCTFNTWPTSSEIQSLKSSKGL